MEERVVADQDEPRARVARHADGLGQSEPIRARPARARDERRERERRNCDRRERTARVFDWMKRSHTCFELDGAAAVPGKTSGASGRTPARNHWRRPIVHATTQLIERYYAAFNAGDMDAFYALVAEDVVHDINQGEREIGRERFAAFMQRMNRSYREHLTDIVVFATADGTRAAAEFVVNGTYLASDDGLPPARGQTYVLPAGAFFDIRDGRVARVTNYYNLADWIAQVGDA
ncbi:MAG: hypothetical protein NVS3B17_12920 [Vulcanimicrobiaceae bacterium]